jgi:hypothetical protein
MKIIHEEVIVIGVTTQIAFEDGRVATIHQYDDYPNEILVDGREPTPSELIEINNFMGSQHSVVG